MKRFLLLVFCAVSCATLFGAVNPPSRSPTSGQSGPKKDGLKDEVDKTDVYAIPLDTSEEEEREEQKVLENLQQYEQRKKAQPKEVSTEQTKKVPQKTNSK